MIFIPSSFSKRVIQMHGKKGEAWLASLNENIALCERRWNLCVLQPFHLSYNYVAPVIISNETEAVLKICISADEYNNEINALKLYGGSAMCKLIDSDPERGVLLLEKLKPGNSLVSIVEEFKSIKIASSMITKMKRSFQTTSYPFPTVSDAALGIDRLRKYYKESTGPFPEGIVKKVEALFPEMISSQGDTYVLHGDLHHENILLSDSGWKLIDPKGVIGELEVELIPFLLNYLPKRNFELAIDKRIHTFYKELGINIARTYSWGLCYSLLSAWWNVEDNLGLSDPHLAVLKYFDSKAARHLLQ